jgi:hypothetical protein
MFVYNEVMEFSDWITKKYIDWRGEKVGAASTTTAFAAWLGISKATLSGWMKPGGHNPRDQKTVGKLIERFGEKEVGEILGLSQTKQFPSQLFQFVVEVQAELWKQGINADDPAQQDKVYDTILKVAEERTKYKAE